MRFGTPTDRGQGAAGQASSRILATVAAHALSVCLLTSNGLSGGLLPPAFAGGAPPLNEEQKLAATAWKETDRIFVERTFGDQDWFKRREKLLKATKTGGREETYDEIRAMLKSVDDKYTRRRSEPIPSPSPSPRPSPSQDPHPHPHPHPHPKPQPKP